MKTFPINDNVNKNKGQDCSSMPMTPRTQSSKKKNIIHSTAIILVWYHCFGLVHEMAHLLSAWVLGLWTPPQSFVSFLGVILKAFLGRACEIPTDDAAREQQLWSFYVVRHTGWVTSLLLALLLSCTIKQGKVKRKSLTVVQITAWVTFIEAFSTDFLGIGVVLATGANATTNIFFCGNFGLILINSGWMDEDYGRKALDMLEQMVHITMMRGAQSGGVLAWAVDKNKGNNGTIQSAKGIRSRVVNGKRTDLSKGVRRKVQADSFSNGKIRRGIQTFLGHTRFATSSMATFDGTHPHQWTPPQKRRVYAMKSSSVMNSSSPKPQVGVLVENFITHNGDFDFYTVNDVQYGLSTIQEWLVLATGKPLLSAVDSIAVAGLVDLLRTEGCFGLSARYALLLNCETSKMETGIKLPSYSEFEHLGRLFEDALLKVCKQYSTTMVEIKASSTLRQHFSAAVHHAMNGDYFTVTMAKSTLATLVSIDEEYSDGVSLHELASRTIDAFFDNDLFQATRILMSNAKGSFGLMVTSSLDANRQICLAARGQPISLAFYPKEGLVFYGSELASVKVGLDVKMPPFTNGSPHTQIKIADVNSSDDEVIVEQTSRLDLDDLGGEVVLLDWGCGPIGKDVHVLVHQESRTTQSRIASRIVLLENNEFVRPLTRESRDPVLNDIRDIPRACQYIQDNWKEAGLNRYTAYNLVSKINERLMSRMKGDVPTHCNSIDILLTGCETSLWLAEQFASDLTKSFGRLNVKAVSSNKLLGIFGQDMSMPAVGFPMSENVPDLKGAVVIIVSHSGQTFAPLACSSLLQSFTDNIFLVSSEWDTQIGRQLRGIGKRKHPLRPGMNDLNFIYSSRIFTTDVGVRPAEPCSVSVAAIQQLLTQLYMHVSISLLAGPELRTFCGAIVTESDLRILERCNQESINALECIVGSDRFGVRSIIGTNTEQELRRAGNVWSEHVLENPKAYILTFLYVVGTVVSGYPFITGVAIAAGLENGWWFYLLRFCDGLLYFFFNQLTIFALRLLQGRSLRHRTTGRTVVIGDCPWVAQSIDSFLSKLFACSYPMAGINVLNGNPADHLVHRHTHRVVRGTLLICGRPDGRLSALTNAEVSVCLSVNQASSIQSIGGTCESITIGHNPSPLAATSKDIFLSNHRPLFLCERVADDLDEVIDDMGESGQKTMLKVPSFVNRGKAMMIDITTGDSHHNRNQSRHSQHVMGRSRHSIQIMDRSKHSLNIMDLSKHSHQIMDLSKHSHHIFDLSKHTCNIMDLSKRKLGTTKLDLSKHANSLTEHVMDDGIWREEDSIGNSDMEEPSNSHEAGFSKFKRKISMRLSKRGNDEGMDVSNSTRKASRRSRRELFRDDSTIVRNGQSRSALEIKGLYATFQILAQAETEKTDCQTAQTFANSLEQRVVDEMLKERQGLHLMRRIFDELDAGKTGFVSVDIFIGSYLAANGELSETQIRQVFKELGIGGDNGLMDFEAFVRLSQMPEVEVIRKLQISAPRNEKGLLLVHPSEEEYFGQELQHSAAASGFEAFALAKTQHFAMELYESRIASLERFVSMCVMFHQMGSRVQCFFEKVSFGFLSYRMDRTHSIMRIATTASPVSGADVRERIEALQVRARVQNALRVIESAWYKYQQRQIRDWKEERSRLSAAHKSCVESAKLLSSETVLPTPDPPLDETTELNALKSSFSRSLGQKDWSTASLGDNRSGSVRFENTENNPTTVSTMRKSLPPRSLGTPDTSVGSRGVDNNHSSGTVRFENSATDLSVGSDEVKSPPAPRSFGESYSSMRSLGGNRSGSIRFGNREISPTVIHSFVQAGTGHQAAAGRQRADATATVWGNSQTSAESRRSGTPLSLASLILHFEAASQQLN